MSAWIEIAGPDGAFAAYQARPAGPAKGAVIVIQEIFGVNSVVRGKADWLAREGFLAIAPDLFWRLEPRVELTDQSEQEWSRAFALMNAFDIDKGVEDIKAALAYAHQEGAQKVGAIGYCLGGLLAYLTATRTQCDASVGYYGVSIDQRLDEAASIRKPLMLHIAGKDGFVKPEAQQAMHKGLGGNPLVTLHDYANEDHAFTREGGANYSAAAAQQADARTLAFLKEHLS